jgi:DNA-binding protein HU-beta
LHWQEKSSSNSQPKTLWRFPLNKSELIESLAAKTNLSKTSSARALDALVDIISHTVAKKESVQLVGFGTFKASKRAARTGRNPRTGVALKIAATTVPQFSAGVAFKELVAKRKR